MEDVLVMEEDIMVNFPFYPFLPLPFTDMKRLVIPLRAVQFLEPVTFMKPDNIQTPVDFFKPMNLWLLRSIGGGGGE